MNAYQVARGLGWFSLGLGAVEVLAPGRVRSLVGAGEHRNHDGLVRAYGVRELVAGAALLLQPGAATTWMWSRVAGDVLDLATLGRARPAGPQARGRHTHTLLMLSGVMVVDVLVARMLSLQTPATPAGRPTSRLHPTGGKPR